MKKTQNEKLIELFSDLYVSTRYKFIRQNNAGEWKWVEKEKVFLTDNLLGRHLEKKETVGVFAQGIYTKFICFDIDCNAESPEKLRELILVLTEDFDLTREQILISFSGSKGYHVELFFDKAIPTAYAKRFYHMVLKVMNERTDRIEYRPTDEQAVKLPMSIHKKTGNKCYLMDSYTYKEVPNSYIFKINKIIASEFIEKYELMSKEDITLPEKKIEQTTKVIGEVEHHLPVDYEARCLEMLGANSLLYPNSRHDSVRYLASFLKCQLDYNIETTKDTIRKVILNTFTENRSFISEKTTEEYALSEIDRVVELVYEKNYTLPTTQNYKIRIYEEELLEVLKPKKIGLKKLAYIMLVHSKKHAKGDGTFFMTYEQINKMAETENNRGRLLTQLKKLEELGYLTIIERDRKNGHKHLPNIYKVNVTTSKEKYIEFDSAEKNYLILEQVVAKLIPEETLKSLISKEQFYTKFKPLYKIS